uniref:SyrP-like protein n=1 Tax=uncultured bacterium esnapd14 TaxID=1366594 RepID=S5TL62_9BACT|nr:SyrP-like protein [uncultured bacterium esnapd14]
MNTSPLGAARRQPVATSAAGWVVHTGELSLPYVVRPTVEVELARWARDQVSTVDGWLHTHGAVLFRGFGIGLDGFAAVAAALAGPPLPYRERSTPRTQLADGVYTSTEYPADQSIPLHNENAYQRCFPARLVFGCVTPPAAGGATPLADCRRVLARIDPATVEAFRRRQVRYVRHFHEGMGLSWREAFGESDPQRVDEYCAAHDIAPHWRDGHLRTEQLRPAIARHPVTGEQTWFNHVNLFHPSALAEPVHAALVAQYGADRLPTDVSYGDGSAIDIGALARIRAAYAAETVAVPWQAGDVLLVDNVLVAHGRQSYEGPRRIVVSMGGMLCHEDTP